MPNVTKIPLSLYIHLPWCIQKCPYCDFNSHALNKNHLPEEAYVSALLKELNAYLPYLMQRSINSIFFGGGTPSLFSPHAIARIIEGVKEKLVLSPHCEVTLEANPGAIDHAYFDGFFKAGVNRLSLGVQSFQDDKLKVLGRIHGAHDAKDAIIEAKKAGFTNLNIDLMFGLPGQNLADAIFDLNTAINFEVPHLSWYQLTLEANTFFYKNPPKLPDEEIIADIQLTGQTRLQEAAFTHYEVSAYAKENKMCMHNRNYWEFGDYLGLGAGAHSKMTFASGEVKRFMQVKHPKDYLKDPLPFQHLTLVSEKALIFEFMLNALRLRAGIPVDLFFERTGLSLSHIKEKLEIAKKKRLIKDEQSFICPTLLGMQFHNDLVAIFL